MENIAPIILACVALLTALGAAVAWLWNKLEHRFTEIELALAECKKRELDAVDRRQLSRAAMELLWQELKRTAPKSPVLARAKKLMDEMKVESTD